VLVHNRVDEADRRLARTLTGDVDAMNKAGEMRRGGTSATTDGHLAKLDHGEEGAVGSDVGIRAAVAVVQSVSAFIARAASAGVVTVEAVDAIRVVEHAGICAGEEIAHSALLVVRRREAIREATAGEEEGSVQVRRTAGYGNFEREGGGVDHGAADGGNPGTHIRKVRAVDSVVGTETAVEPNPFGVVGWAGNAKVAGVEEHRHTLQAELEVLVALASLVVEGQQHLRLGIGDGDDVRRSINAAH
jgi:hypothetical protein